jgi:hypothetical protein
MGKVIVSNQMMIDGVIDQTENQLCRERRRNVFPVSDLRKQPT